MYQITSKIIYDGQCFLEFKIYYQFCIKKNSKVIVQPTQLTCKNKLDQIQDVVVF